MLKDASLEYLNVPRELKDVGPTISYHSLKASGLVIKTWTGADYLVNVYRLNGCQIISTSY